jgi:hypothetical protein
MASAIPTVLAHFPTIFADFFSIHQSINAVFSSDILLMRDSWAMGNKNPGLLGNRPRVG